jgi:hypothetical protein
LEGKIKLLHSDADLQTVPLEAIKQKEVGSMLQQKIEHWPMALLHGVVK